MSGFKDNLDIVCALLKDNSLAHFVSRGFCLLAGGYEALSYNRLKKRPMGFKIHLKRVVAFLDCIPSFLLSCCVSLSAPLLVTDTVPTVAERGIELKVSLTVARRGIEFKDNLFVAERGIELKVSLFVAESGIEIEVSLIVSTYPRHQLLRLATGAAVVVDHYSLDCLENDVEDSQLPFFNQSTF